MISPSHEIKRFSTSQLVLLATCFIVVAQPATGQPGNSSLNLPVRITGRVIESSKRRVSTNGNFGGTAK